MNSTLLARLGAAGFFVNLALHTMAVSGVRDTAMKASPELGVLMPLLWLLWSVAAFLFGLIVFIHARPASPQRRPVLLLAALFPVATALGQYIAFGPIFPEATLLLTALLTAAAALTKPQTAPSSQAG